jgi:hypothetical protein
MPSSTASRALVPGLCLIVALFAACSLTYQSVYEGDVRFEHCYRLDEERQIPIGEKRTCWHDWSQKYTYGQTRDRIEYALSRERILGQAQASGDRSAPPGASAALLNANVSPQPTNAFAPPPPTMQRDAGSADADRQPMVAALVQPASSPPPPMAPGASCGGTCGKTWVQCGEQCKGTSCQGGCDERYRSCMRACF